ncbi:hypothetical protein [Ruminococcus albus]|uniref:hypothetical protein n=1 Tax=Ruminococcus albus TaxID=1264 RepID=UPI001FA6F21F|nr:hypothetical protein [Ruminococcus albus]
MFALNAASSFESPELISIPDDVLKGFYKQNSGLELYRRQLERIRRRKDHVLSKRRKGSLRWRARWEIQQIRIYSMFSDADLKFEDAVDSEGKTHQVTHGSYIPLVKDADRELRKSAFTSIYKGYGKFRNTCAATLDSQMKALEFYSKARKL